MFNPQVDFNYFVCEICGETRTKTPLTGIDIHARFAKPIQTCPSCGPIDYEVMQLCREVVTQCKDN